MAERATGPGRGQAGRPDPGRALPADFSRMIVAPSAVGVVVVDDEGAIRHVNQAAADLLGRLPEELIGAQFGIPLAGEDGSEVELRLPGGGTRAAEMRASLTLEGERLQVVALHDLTARRQAEQDLAAAVQRLNLMVSVAAHELNTPISAISMLAQVLRDEQVAMTPTERAQLIDKIVDRTARLQLVVRKLLAASAIDTVGVRTVPEPVLLLDVIIEQLAEVGDRLGVFQVSCSPDLTVFADRAELSMMLANYLDNAFTYGGPPIDIDASEREGAVEIWIADHGPGVRPSFEPSLFERFTREPGVDQQVEGSGQGLWIVRSFAEANGGSAWYERAEHGGAAFCLRLPLPPAPPDRAEGAAP